MNKPASRAVAIVAATAFAIAVPAIQAMTDFGLSPAEFSREGDGTLRAAGYAFSIWGLIYAALAIYALWQASPRTPDSAVLRAVGWPSVIGIAGCGAWILVTAQDWRWTSVAVILISAGAIIFGLWRAGPSKDDRMALWPLGLLGGWLTAASALNILTVATANGLVAPASAGSVAIAGIAVVMVVTGVVIARTRSLPFAASIVWALIAVWVAERAGADADAVGITAAVCAVLVAVGSLLLVARSRP